MARLQISLTCRNGHKDVVLMIFYSMDLQCGFVGCIPVHLDFIHPVHLDHHTSGSSRPSYLRYIQSFHTSGSSRFYSYLWFIQIFFISLVHLEHHTSGSSRIYSQHWFIQKIIPPVLLGSTMKTLCPKYNLTYLSISDSAITFKKSPYFNITLSKPNLQKPNLT